MKHVKCYGEKNNTDNVYNSTKRKEAHLVQYWAFLAVLATREKLGCVHTDIVQKLSRYPKVKFKTINIYIYNN